MDFKRSSIPLYLATLVILLRRVEAVGGVCAQIVHGNFYDLGKAQADIDYTVDVANGDGKIFFNFCEYSRVRCPGKPNSFAVYKTDDKCIPLTIDSQTTGYSSNLIEYKNGSTALNMTFTGNTPSETTTATNNSYYKVEFDLICVSGATDMIWTDPPARFYDSNSTFVITGKGAVFCPKYSGSYLVDFMNKFSFLYAIFAILAGGFQTFYGYKLYRPTIFLIGFIFGFIAVGLFLFAIWTGQETSSYKGYIIFFLALVSGVGAGFIVITFSWVGLIISGSILGFFISLFLYTLILFRIVSYPPNLLFYNIMLIGMVCGAIAGYEYQDIILVLSCSISGAYLTIRGLSVFLGGFPNEFELATKLKSGEDTGTGAAFYFYMLMIILLAVGGIYYQLRMKKIDVQKLQIEEDANEMLVRSAEKEGKYS